MSRTRIAGLCGALTAIALAVGGCGSAQTSSTGSTAPAAAPVDVGQGSAAPWWHGGDDYCTVLRETMKASGTALGAASDGSRATVVRAFVAQLEHVAPGGLAAQWRLLAPAVIGLAGSPAAGQKLDVTALRRAAAAVATDARRRCDLVLSRPAA